MAEMNDVLTVAAQEARRNNTLTEERRSLLDERPDPDAPVARPCEAERHCGANPAVRPGTRFLLQKEKDGAFSRRRHEGGGEEIRGGDFLVREDEEGVAKAVFYCRRCREAARRDARRGGYRLTWYVSAAAGRKIAAIATAAERRSRAVAAEKAAATKGKFFPSTPRGKRRGG